MSRCNAPLLRRLLATVTCAHLVFSVAAVSLLRSRPRSAGHSGAHFRSTPRRPTFVDTRGCRDFVEQRLRRFGVRAARQARRAAREKDEAARYQVGELPRNDATASETCHAARACRGRRRLLARRPRDGEKDGTVNLLVAETKRRESQTAAETNQPISACRRDETRNCESARREDGTHGHTTKL